MNLIPSESSHDVRFSCGHLDRTGDCHQCHVPSLVTMGVVYLFQPVQVDEQDTE